MDKVVPLLDVIFCRLQLQCRYSLRDCRGFIAAGIDQKHFEARQSKARRQRASSRTRSDNDVIVLRGVVIDISLRVCVNSSSMSFVIFEFEISLMTGCDGGAWWPGLT